MELDIKLQAIMSRRDGGVDAAEAARPHGPYCDNESVAVCQLAHIRVHCSKPSGEIARAYVININKSRSIIVEGPKDGFTIIAAAHTFVKGVPGVNCSGATSSKCAASERGAVAGHHAKTGSFE